MEPIGKKFKEREETLRQEEEYYQPEAHETVTEFAERNRGPIIGGLAVVLLLIVGGFAWKYYQDQQAEEANDQMSMAMTYFINEDYENALNGDANGNLGFTTIADKYGSNETGNLARYHAGVASIKTGQLDAGIDYLESVDGESTLGVMKHTALGFAYEEKQDFEEAAEHFEKAAFAIEQNDSSTPYLLMQAARNYESAGNNAKALELYKDIKEDFPLSPEAAGIEKYIARASA